MKIGLMGYGVVGKGVDYILQKNNTDYNIVKILKKTKINDERAVYDFEEFINNDYDIIVETIGGTQESYYYVSEALRRGIPVVTSNKALICDKGIELFNIASEKKVPIRYSAAVGGVIPILELIRNNLIHEDINYIEGILNGTTNFILTKCIEDKSSIDECIKIAQDLGYAEEDPCDDIEGYDAGRKIAIITSLIAKKKYDLNDVYIKGIKDIKDIDFEIANEVNAKIRLVAKAEFNENEINLTVLPMFVFKSHPFYSINGVKNAFISNSKTAGEIMISGSGAGSLPTASSVVSDILAINLDNYNKYYLEESCNKISKNKKNFNYLIRSNIENKRFKLVKNLQNGYIYFVKNVREDEFDDIVSLMQVDWFFIVEGAIC